MDNMMMPESAEILEIVHETKAEYTFRVACDEKIMHGQFFQLSIPKVGEAPISVSAIGDGWVEFTIRKVGRLTDGIFGLKKGNHLFMRGPYGNSYPVNDFYKKDLVVIAGGTGVAAVRSLLKHVEENRDKFKEMHLIVGFKNIDCVLFEDDLNQFRKSFKTIYTLDRDSAEGFETGLIPEYIKKVPFSSFEDYNVVIVGPPIMMKFATAECINQGADESKMWVSFERKMSCAMGKCGHCKIDETYVCLEGPVFNFREAKELLD